MEIVGIKLAFYAQRSQLIVSSAGFHLAVRGKRAPEPDCAKTEATDERWEKRIREELRSAYAQLESAV